jgi:asparagine N-glycosylation enzyme membrane subunit Stt3
MSVFHKICLISLALGFSLFHLPFILALADGSSFFILAFVLLWFVAVLIFNYEALNQKKKELLLANVFVIMFYISLGTFIKMEGNVLGFTLAFSTVLAIFLFVFSGFGLLLLKRKNIKS